MKAIRFHEYGGPEVLKFEEVPDPVPGPGEALLRVHAVGVNPTDITTRSGRGNTRPGFSFPAMFGRDACGTVEAIGDGVTSLAVGDRVVVREADYTYAEMAVAKEQQLYKVPDALGNLEAAAVGITYATAWDAVVNRANVQSGETVLVQGAAGGVGIAAVQIAKHLGATVIGTSASDDKLKWAATQGMDHGVNYSANDWPAQVKELTGGKGVDVIIDGVGGDPFVRCFECIVPEGRIAMFGAAAGREISFNIGGIFRNMLTLRGAGGRGTSRADFERLLELLAAGKLTPTIDRTWPLAEAAEAQRYVEERRVLGKVVLTV